MKRIKDLLFQNASELKDSFKSFPVTYILAYICTIAMTVCYYNKFFEKKFGEDVVEYILAFYVASIFTVWIVENIFKSKLYRVIGYVISIIAGCILSEIVVYNLADQFSNTRIFWGCIVSFASICLFVIIRKLKVNSYKYALDLWQNLFNANVLFFVINIGLTLVVEMFIGLIVGGEGYTIRERLQIILWGIVYVTLLIMAFTRKKSHITVFVKKLVKYVMYPITLLAMIIIYIYMIKIFALKQIPSNEIYRIVLCIFVLGYPNIIMIKNYIEDNKIYKISEKIAPIAFIPLVGLQIYAMSSRCKVYGMTTNRYIAIVWIIVEMAVIIGSIIRKKDILDYSLVVVAILSIIATLTPINMEKVAFTSQSKIIKSILKEDVKFKDLSKKDKNKVTDAYIYLDENNIGKKFIEEHISEDNIESMNSYCFMYKTSDGEYSGDTTKSIYFEMKDNKVYDIEKYERMKYIDTFVKEDDKEEEYVELIKELVKEHGEGLEKELAKKKVVKLSKTKDVIFTSITIDYVLTDEGEVEPKYCVYGAIELHKKGAKEEKEKKEEKK